MLQSPMRSQLARLEIRETFLFSKIPDLVTGGIRTFTPDRTLGPVDFYLHSVRKMLKYLKPDEKHWACTGIRSIAVAVELLRDNKVIALPTDTVYGLAGLAESNSSIENIYKIKKRDEKKPLAISISNVNNIGTWGVINHLPPGLLEDILPGPYTVILKRTPALNPALNPDNDDVAIRVPDSHFITSITDITGPLALTSANLSNEPSAISPNEFSELWPLLGGIFHHHIHSYKLSTNKRIGSTIVDLSQHGKFKIVRTGIRIQHLKPILLKYKLRECKSGSES